LAQIPKRVGFNISQGKWFLTDTVSFDWKTHDVERNLKLLEVMGIKEFKPEVELPLKNSSFDFDAFLKEHGISANATLVGINPGSVWATKRWVPEYFAKVADNLTKEQNCKVLIFGTAKDADAVNGVVGVMKEKAVNLCGKTNLKELTTLISKCKLFVTNDSGSMHIACACQVPVVAIFGPTTRELGFFPYGEKSKVVEVDLKCRPCTLHGGNVCPLGHFKCMKDVTPEMVIEECKGFLPKS
jgi:heptosyltransferase-2